MSLSADIVAVLCLLTLSLLSYERKRDRQGWRGNCEDCFTSVCVCVATAVQRVGGGRERDSCRLAREQVR